MKITEEQRSMIATAFVAAYDYNNGAENKRRSICCGPDALAACAVIVGERYAPMLNTWAHEELGCGGWKDTDYQEQNEQYMLDKISVLDELRGPTCDFRHDHDPVTDRPCGERCGNEATHRIEWADGRYSYGCDAHLKVPLSTVKQTRVTPL